MPKELEPTEEPEASPYKPMRRFLISASAAGLAISLFFAGWNAGEYVDKRSGPKFGIDAVSVIGCGQLDGMGPVNTKAGKEVIRDFKSLGFVRVSLETRQVHEGSLRDPGLFDNPAVNYNQLTIECSDSLTPDEETQLASVVSQDQAR